jgi:hypothetical protein
MECFKISPLISTPGNGAGCRQDVTHDTGPCQVTAKMLKIMMSILDSQLFETIIDDACQLYWSIHGTLLPSLSRTTSLTAEYACGQGSNRRPSTF